MEPPKPPRCPKGYIGTPPKCTKAAAEELPEGLHRPPPNCTKMAFNKPINGLKDVQKQFRNLKVPKKD